MAEERRQNLYDSFREIREVKKQPYHRILIAGYFNDEEVKKEDLNT